MRQYAHLALLLLLTISACGPQEPPRIERKNEPDVFAIDAAHAEMHVATAKAKATLGTFDTALSSGDPANSRFAIKQAFMIPEGVEEIWISRISKNGERYYGVLTNKPLHAKDLAKGDSVAIDTAAIRDWMFVRNDTLQGGYTMRLLRSRLSEEDKKQFDSETEYEVPEWKK